MTRNRLSILISAFLTILVLPGCASSRSASTGFEDVQSKVSTLIGKEVEWNPAPQGCINCSVDDALQQKELTVDDAVQIALRKNPTLQATFEELGIAEADVKEAGYMKNPSFFTEVRFPDAKGFTTNTHFDLAFSFIDMLLTPMRKKVEAMRFDATKTRVTIAVLNLAADVRSAYFQVQAQQAKLPLRKDALLAAEAASEFVQKLEKAKNSPEINTAPKLLQFYQTRLDAGRDALELAGLLEKLSRLMGVPASQIKDRIPGKLPDLPPADDMGSPDSLEALAVAGRLDLEMQRQDVAIVDKARSLRQWWAFTAVEPGATTEQGPEAVRVTGPTLQMDLPIFNRGQADRLRLKAQLRQSQDKLAALELSVRSEVREMLAKIAAARETVEEYQKNIGPLRAKVVDLAQGRYNSMTMGAVDLLTAKQEQLASQMEQLDAQRDYWTIRVELERTLGGRLPAPATTAPTQDSTSTDAKK